MANHSPMTVHVTKMTIRITSYNGPNDSRVMIPNDTNTRTPMHAVHCTSMNVRIAL